MVLEKVVEYFQYWYKYKEREDVPDMEIPVELCLELLMAADYLGIDRKVSSRYPKNGFSPSVREMLVIEIQD
jgi:transcription elongation factor B subunit 1